MLVYGGISNNGTVLQDLWAFNYTSKQWTLLSTTGGCSNCPPALFGHAVGIVNFGKAMLLFGGFYAVGLATNKLFSYSLEDFTWNQIAYSLDSISYGSDPLEPRAELAAFSTPETFVLFGGETNGSFSCATCIHVFNLTSNTFQRIKPEGYSPSPVQQVTFRSSLYGLWLYGASGIVQYTDDGGYCGDSITQLWEECDSQANTCINCTLRENLCMNNILDPGEECDGGQMCSNQCTCPASYFPDHVGGCLPETWDQGLYLMVIPCVVLLVLYCFAVIISIRHMIEDNNTKKNS